MRKLTKDLTYIVKVHHVWYIVHQTGQRSWEAMVFTHLTRNCSESAIHLKGNSYTLLEQFAKMDEGYNIFGYRDITKMRRDMFEILKVGYING